MTLSTEYEFVLPRGYVDHRGSVHRHGRMRLATARDELAPLRDPLVTGPDDPRVTILVLSRVVTALGDVELITTNEIEGLFAADLAFLQDFYGVINFGSQEEYEELLRAQQELPPRPVPRSATAPVAADSAAPLAAAARTEEDDPEDEGVREGSTGGGGVRSSIERIGSLPRRAAVEEVSSRPS